MLYAQAGRWTTAITITLLQASVLLPGVVSAQRKPALAAEVKALSAKVDEALKGAAEASSTARALQDLALKLSSLRSEVDAMHQMKAGFQADRSKLEAYEARVAHLELDLAGIKMQVEESAAAAGYNDGFFVQSPDGKFLIRLGGLAQFAYEGRLVDDNALGSGDRFGVDESTFLLRRARISASGHLLSWRLSYLMELDYGSQDPGPLLEGWGEFHLHRVARLRAGRQKIPFGRQFLIHAAYLQFTERSGVTRSFARGWDLGAVLLGNVPFAGVVSYQLGIFNGSGETSRDENTDFLYAARLLYQPLGKVSYEEGDTRVGKFQLAVGGAVTYNLAQTDNARRREVEDGRQPADRQDADGDGTIDNVGVLQFGAELVARMGGLAWQSELFFREEDPGSVGEERRFWGAYTQWSFFHYSTSLEMAARYSFWEPNHYNADRSGVLPGQAHQVTGVLNGLLWRQRIRWQVEYSYGWFLDMRVADVDVAGDPRIHTFRLQAQLSF